MFLVVLIAISVSGRLSKTMFFLLAVRESLGKAKREGKWSTKTVCG
jgi:hypothetical protein